MEYDDFWNTAPENTTPNKADPHVMCYSRTNKGQTNLTSAKGKNKSVNTFLL